MRGIDDLERVEVASATMLWDWLDANHGQAESVLLVTWKAKRRDRYVSRHEVLDALIAYGWIDGRRYTLDDERTMQLISPRKQQTWAASYKDRAAQLDDDGRMRPPGVAAIERAKELGTWDSLADVDRLEDPDDLRIALADRDAVQWWSSAAPSYRRNVLRWIANAKRPATRDKRIRTVAEHAARGEKVPNY
ncbi:MAG: YdeI/OmpD-associated family protein [Actinomycetota bacterium]